MARTKTETLIAKKRDHVGTRYARRVRQLGGLPAVLYGHGQDPAALTLDAKQASLHITAGKKVFTVKIDGGGEDTALLRDIQFDHLGSSIIHVDLARVSLTERVEIHVRVELKGECVGLKTAGAVLVHPMTEITVRCLVTDIVDHVEADITNLDVGHVLHASDVVLPPGYELITGPRAVLASIQIKAAEAEPEAAPVEGEGAEPEVITERKPGEEGKEPAKEGKEGKEGKEDKAPKKDKEEKGGKKKE